MQYAHAHFGLNVDTPSTSLSYTPHPRALPLLHVPLSYPISYLPPFLKPRFQERAKNSKDTIERSIPGLDKTKSTARAKFKSALQAMELSTMTSHPEQPF